MIGKKCPLVEELAPVGNKKRIEKSREDSILLALFCMLYIKLATVFTIVFYKKASVDARYGRRVFL